MKLFALDATRAWGEAVSEVMDRPLDRHEERVFDDGEHKSRPLESVRGEECYIIQSLHAGPDAAASEKMIRLFFFASALRQNGAKRIIAVIPYLAYARKDRRTKPRDPVTTRYVAELMEAAGIDAVLTSETHNLVALENAFRIETHHLAPYEYFAEYARAFAGDAPIVVASPDPGGVKRAQLFRETLETTLNRDVGFALVEKRRSGGRVSGSLSSGDVDNAAVIVIDDMIASGRTMARAAEMFKENGAAKIAAYAAHGLFMGGAPALFDSPAIEEVLVTDTVPAFRLHEPQPARLHMVSAAPLFARAVMALAGGGSLTDILVY